MKKLALILLFTGFLDAALAETYPHLSCRYTDEEQLGDEQGVYIQIDGTLEILGDNESTLTANVTYSRFDAKIVDGKIVITDMKTQKPAVRQAFNDKTYKGRKYGNHFRFLAFTGDGDANGYLIIGKTPRTEKRRPPFPAPADYYETVYVFEAALDVSYNDHHGDYVEMQCEALYKGN